MTRTKDKFFKPEDFESIVSCEPAGISYYAAAAAKLNAILSKYIEENGLTVYHDKITHKGGNFGLWHEQPSKDDTHKAVLLFIEELKHDKSEGGG